MKNYAFTAVDLNGKKSRGVECADDCWELVEKLRKKNLFCIKYKELNGENQTEYRFKTKELCLISRQLSFMLGAGLSLVKALEILRENSPDKKRQKALSSVYQEVQKGRSFSESLSAQGDMFPALFINMAAAGELSGTLDKTLARIAVHYEKNNKTDNRIKAAFTYPIILGMLTLGIIATIFAIVIPPFAELVDPEDMTALSKFITGFSNTLVNYWYVYLAAITAIIFMVKLIPESPSLKAAADLLKLRIPVLGKLFITLYTGRFARNLSSLYGAGIQMLNCIEISAAALDNTYLQNRLSGAAENIKNGESLSEALEKTGIFDKMFTALIYSGENSGMLEEILDKAADFYEEETDSKISGLANFIQPTLIIIIAAAAGLMLAAVFHILYGGMSGMM